MHTQVYTCTSDSTEERARERSSNPAPFDICTQCMLDNHSMKWVYLSDCQFRNIIKIVLSSAPNSDIRKVRKEEASDAVQQPNKHLHWSNYSSQFSSSFESFSFKILMLDLARGLSYTTSKSPRENLWKLSFQWYFNITSNWPKNVYLYVVLFTCLYL